MKDIRKSVNEIIDYCTDKTTCKTCQIKDWCDKLYIVYGDSPSKPFYWDKIEEE